VNSPKTDILERDARKFGDVYDTSHLKRDLTKQERQRRTISN